ncbi:MAG TPA: lipid A biosynthesis acyltransferase [Arcobacter sp.]|nr:lipid A biosynthesis acyltransferase [Arcobacter sp.]HIP56192.1 lipid A biosynthesis acyltransferase [Arcobacter sp.]
MFDYFIFSIYKVFKFFILIIPKSIIKIFLDGLSKFIYLINAEHKRYAFANLDFVLKNTISKDEKKDIVKNTYKNLVYNLYDFIENQTLDLVGFEKKITVKNDDVLTNAIKNNRKIILITAHYGNWEYGNTFIPLKYKPTTMVGRPMNNKFFNEELTRTREKNNTKMLEKKEAARGLVKALKEDRIIGLVIDQHNSTGIEVNLFGHKVLQTDSSSKLAVKFDAIIIPLFFQRTSFGKYDAIFYDGIEAKDYEGDNQIQDLTQAQANIIEEQIRKEPSQWFWQHKRFKVFNQEIYKK